MKISLYPFDKQVRSSIFILFFLLCSLPAVLVAQSEEDMEQARIFFEQAEAHYKLLEYENALEDYQASYRFSLRPELLFNIAQCYRKLGQYEKAIQSYAAYLRDIPDAPERATVEKLIRDLQTDLEQSAHPESEKTSSTLESSIGITKESEEKAPVQNIDPIKSAEPPLVLPVKDSNESDGSTKNSDYLRFVFYGGAVLSVALGANFFLRANAAKKEADLLTDLADPGLSDLVALREGHSKTLQGLGFTFLGTAIVTGGVGWLLKRPTKVESSPKQGSQTKKNVRLSIAPWGVFLAGEL